MNRKTGTKSTSKLPVSTYAFAFHFDAETEMDGKVESVDPIRREQLHVRDLQTSAPLRPPSSSCIYLRAYVYHAVRPARPSRPSRPCFPSHPSAFRPVQTDAVGAAWRRRLSKRPKQPKPPKRTERPKRLKIAVELARCLQQSPRAAE